MTRHSQAGIAVAVVISITVHAGGAAYLLNRVIHLAEQPQRFPGARLVNLTLVPAITPDAAPRPSPAPALQPEALVRTVKKSQPRPVENQHRWSAPDMTAKPEFDQTPLPQQASELSAVVASTTPTATEQPEPGQAAVPETAINYLAQLLEHIDEHKFYPRSARRRGLEGRVEVSFRLLADGNIRDLRVSGGSRILRRAAEQALQRALPMPTPHSSMQLQQHVNFDMEYRLGKT